MMYFMSYNKTLFWACFNHWPYLRQLCWNPFIKKSIYFGTMEPEVQKCFWVLGLLKYHVVSLATMLTQHCLRRLCLCRQQDKFKYLSAWLVNACFICFLQINGKGSVILCGDWEHPKLKLHLTSSSLFLEREDNRFGNDRRRENMLHTWRQIIMACLIDRMSCPCDKSELSVVAVGHTPGISDASH